MATFTEQFEETSLHELIENKPFKTAKGLTITLLTSPIELQAKPSGIRALPLADRPNNRQLVIGDHSIVRIEFGRLVSDLSFYYHHTLDYTEEDKLAEYGDAPDIDIKKILVEKATISNFNFSGNGADSDYLIQGSKTSRVFHQHTAPFRTLEITTSRIGEVHLDALMWRNA